MIQPDLNINSIVKQSVDEDLILGDITTEGLLSPDVYGIGLVISKSCGILAGIDALKEVFNYIDQDIEVKTIITDGAKLRQGDVIAEIRGKLHSILKGERTSLNFLQHLSGVATETYNYVTEVDGHKTKILDTRKTTPGLRSLEKYAVRVGGGNNHRYNLGDGILIKDNHIKAMRFQGLCLVDIVKKARSNFPKDMKIQVEVENLQEVYEALDGGADALLLDNMDIALLQKAVDIVNGRVILEASGGINIDNVRDVAATGVDFISVGSITHSKKSFDISLDVSKDSKLYNS